MIKAIIVDDETAAVEIIERIIGAHSPDIQISATAHSVRDAITALRRHDPDILFLDIELGDGLGFEILETLPDLRARIVFITAYEHYALRAIKFHAFDYILKPLVPDELHAVLHKVRADIRKKDPLPDGRSLLRYLKSGMVQKIAVPSKNGLHYYPINSIIYIEGDGSYVKMCLENSKDIMITRKVRDFEEGLAEVGFLRVHRSYLVNIEHISELHRDDGGYLLMSNGRKVPISPKDKEEIISLIKGASYTI